MEVATSAHWFAGCNQPLADDRCGQTVKDKDLFINGIFPVNTGGLLVIVLVLLQQ